MAGVTLKVHHGGVFKSSKSVILYLGGEISTIKVDPDHFCGFWFKELAEKSGNYTDVSQVLYLIPGSSMVDGLRTVFVDDEIRSLADIAQKHIVIDFFVAHGENDPLKMNMVGSDTVGSEAKRPRGRPRKDGQPPRPKGSEAKRPRGRTVRGDRGSRGRATGSNRGGGRGRGRGGRGGGRGGRGANADWPQGVDQAK